jgi:hypothetical protein
VHSLELGQASGALPGASVVSQHPVRPASGPLAQMYAASGDGHPLAVRPQQVAVPDTPSPGGQVQAQS